MSPAHGGSGQGIWNAPTPKQAEAAFDAFLEDREATYPKAAECLRKDREELLSFDRLPAEHWKHLRTMIPIEVTFATIHHRHHQTKGNGRRCACLAMVFKSAQAAMRSRRRLNGWHQLVHVIRGMQFIGGECKVGA